MWVRCDLEMVYGKITCEIRCVDLLAAGGAGVIGTYRWRCVRKGRQCLRCVSVGEICINMAFP